MFSLADAADTTTMPTHSTQVGHADTSVLWNVATGWRNPRSPLGELAILSAVRFFRLKVSATPQVCTGSAEAKGSIHKAITSTESQGCQAGREHSGSNLTAQAGSSQEQDCIHTALEYRRWGRLHTLSGQPVPLHCNRGYSDNTFSKEQN